MTSGTTNPTTLVLIRHGETDANARGSFQGAGDDPLNERGRAQARWVAKRLAARELAGHTLYCSPLRRAQETADAIMDALGGDWSKSTEPGLAEYRLGEWEGLTYEVLRDEKRLWTRIAADPNFAPPGGESAMDFTIRTMGAIQGIAQAHPGEAVVVVSHGGALSTAMAALLTGDGRRWTEFQMDNAAISELVFDPQPRLVRLNEVVGS